MIDTCVWIVSKPYKNEKRNIHHLLCSTQPMSSHSIHASLNPVKIAQHAGQIAETALALQRAICHGSTSFGQGIDCSPNHAQKHDEQQERGGDHRYDYSCTCGFIDHIF